MLNLDVSQFIVEINKKNTEIHMTTFESQNHIISCMCKLVLGTIHLLHLCVAEEDNQSKRKGNKVKLHGKYAGLTK